MPVYELGDLRPQIDPTAWVAPNAVVVGNVHLGANVSVWWNAVIRGDMSAIRIGARTNIQDGSVLHVDTDVPLTIGEGVTVGHMVMLHGSTIGDNCLIGIGAIVLNRSVIGRNTIVAANTLIPEGKVFPEGVMVMGSPGKVIRDLTEKELAGLARPTDHYVENAVRYRDFLKAM